LTASIQHHETIIAGQPERDRVTNDNLRRYCSARAAVTAAAAGAVT
jgi:hypothetical protein